MLLKGRTSIVGPLQISSIERNQVQNERVTPYFMHTGAYMDITSAQRNVVDGVDRALWRRKTVISGG